MADPNLTESAWQRAKVDAAGVYKTATFGVVLAMMELLAVPAAVLATVGHEDTARQVVIPILSGAFALAFAFIVVLTIQVAAAPIRQRNELRAAWSAPQAQTGTIVKLWNAYRKGCDLSARMEELLPQERDWKAAEAWAEETAGLLAGNVPEQAAREFFEAGGYETDLVRQIDDRTGELKKLIEGLG